MFRVLLIVFAVLPALAGAGPIVRSSPAGEAALGYPNFRFQRGDDARWAATDFDDRGWAALAPRELPSRSGIYWVRWHVQSRGSDLFPPPDGLLFKVVASYDVYWDGRLIGRNGRVSASAEDEGPGYIDALFQIPAELLAPGDHVIALRMSSLNTGFPTPTYSLLYVWGNFRSLLVERARTAMFSILAVGAALVVAVVFGLMWLLAGRRLALLLFSILFLCVAALQGLQAWRWLYEYPYNWHYPRLLATTALATAMAALLPAFVLHHFELPQRGRTYTALAVLLVVPWVVMPIYNAIALTVCSIGFVSALILAVRAAGCGRRGALAACVGLMLSVFALFKAPRDFLDHAFFISAGPAVIGLLVALVLQLRDERREAQRAVLTAARLETELLKKNIQPHFLLNTLATIQEVIEQEPTTAVALIDALASEFRILARVSGEKLISLAQELELCRAHLQVMSLRKGASCSLRVSGPEGDALIPPALLHTLIENGLTHLLARAGRHDFELSIERRTDTIRYVLLARGQRHASATEDAAPNREGTGMRYIKARLEESFTGRWSLDAGPVLEGWETVIEIRVAGARAETAHRAVAKVTRPVEKLA